MDHFHSNPTNHTWLFWSRAFTLRVLVEGPQHITVMVDKSIKTIYKHPRIPLFSLSNS